MMLKIFKLNSALKHTFVLVWFLAGSNAENLDY